MAERAIHHKKNNFLNSIAPVSVSFDELVREKLECGKFPLTKTGIIKVVSMVLCLVSIAMFLQQVLDEDNSKKCSSTQEWFKQHAFTGCMGTTLLVELGFYMIFSFGLTVTSPGLWVTADIICNLVAALVGIIGSVMSTFILDCSVQVPGPLGIAGGVVSLGGCAAIFLLYRYVEDEDESEIPQPPETKEDPRKSMHA